MSWTISLSGLSQVTMLRAGQPGLLAPELPGMMIVEYMLSLLETLWLIRRNGKIAFVLLIALILFACGTRVRARTARLPERLYYDTFYIPGDAPNCGLGMCIARKLPDTLIVVGFAAGSPAEKSGLQVGDEVERINGQTVRDRLPSPVWREQVESLLTGANHSDIKLECRRNGSNFSTTAICAPIPTETLVAETIASSANASHANFESHWFLDGLSNYLLLRHAHSMAEIASTEKLVMESLNVLQRELGSDNADVVCRRATLCLVQLWLEKWAEAAKNFDAVMHSRPVLSDDPYLEKSLERLANEYKWGSSESRIYSRHHIGTTIPTKSLAQLIDEHAVPPTDVHDMTKKSVAAYERAWEMLQRSDADRKKKLTLLNAAMELGRREDVWTANVQFARQALDEVEKADPAGSFDDLNYTNKLLAAYCRVKEFVAAEKLCNHKLERYTRELGLKSEAVVEMLNCLAYTYATEGQSERAESTYKRAIALMGNAPEDFKFSGQSTYEEYGVFLQKLGRHEEANQYFQTLHEIQKKARP